MLYFILASLLLFVDIGGPSYEYPSNSSPVILYNEILALSPNFLSDTPINLLDANNSAIKPFNSFKSVGNVILLTDGETIHISAGFHLSDCIDIPSDLDAVLYAL